MDKQNLTLPISIVIAAIVIAGTIYHTKKDNVPPSNQGESLSQKQEIAEGPKEITGEDHVLGNPEAPLTLILYTDFECPFCIKFHETIKQLVDEYGKAGKVRVVFRHFPLDQLHKKSRMEAEASECAASLGGNEIFWQYTDRLFEITPGNDGLDMAELPKIAEYVGINQDQFMECLESKKFSDKVQAYYEDAIASGAQGTPFFVIINQKGEKFPVSSYLPYQELRIGIEQLLNAEN